MRFVIFLLVLILIDLVSFSAQAQDVRGNCKKTKAGSHMALLGSDIQFKPEYAMLREKLVSVDTDKLCDCIFDASEKLFGVEKVRAMSQYSYADSISPETLIAEDHQKTTIRLSCFGQQMGIKNLTPPSSSEVFETITRAPTDEQAAKMKTAKTMKALMGAVNRYSVTYKQYPNSLTQLSDSTGSLLSSAAVKDAWGHDLLMRNHSNSYITLLSKGPDGMANTSDDLSSDRNGNCVNCYAH